LRMRLGMGMGRGGGWVGVFDGIRGLVVRVKVAAKVL
jgi:hypothetical protein